MKQSSYFTWINNMSLDNEWINAEFYSPKTIKIEQNFIKNKSIRVMKLNQIAEVNRVTGFEVEKHLKIVENGVPYLRVKNIGECVVDFEDMQYIPVDVHNRFNKSQFRNNDIALTITGRVGTAAIISDNKEYNACQDVVKISVKEDAIVNPYYLVIYLNTKYNHDLLNRFNSGGSRPRTLINNVREVNIPIPSPKTQKYIGDKVKKAENLRDEANRLKQEAEEILANELNLLELFMVIEGYTEKHSWIIDSDINDRIDALYYNPQKIIINQYYKNYNLKRLKDLVEYKKGYAFKSEDYCDKSSTFLFRVSDISNNEVDMSNMLNLPDNFYQEYKDFNLINGDIVMVVTGNTTGKSILINNNNHKFLLNQNAIRMRLKDEVDISPYYIELILKSPYFQTLLKYSIFQSVQPFISMQFLNDVMIPIIDKTKILDISNLYEKSLNKLFYAKQLILESKQDVEHLIEGNFDSSVVE